MKMKPNKIICYVLALTILTSCAGVAKKFVNSKYKPVSSLEKNAESVKRSIIQLQNLRTADLGVHIKSSTVDSLFRNYFITLYQNDPTLGIQGLKSLKLIDTPVFKFGKQEILVFANFEFALSSDKYIKSVALKFEGRLSPSITNDTLSLAPSFQSIQIEKVKLTKCIFLGNAFKYAINSLCNAFMDNINGQIKTFAYKINYPPFPELKLEEMLNNVENLRVTTQNSLKFKRKIPRQIIFINPDCLELLSDIPVERETGTQSLTLKALAVTPKRVIKQPSYFFNNNPVERLTMKSARMSSDNIEIVPISQIETVNIAQQDFDFIYKNYDSAFHKTWASYLDLIDYSQNQQNDIQLSNEFIGKSLNELFNNSEFDLNYHFSDSKHFSQKISLGDISKPDCSFPFDCGSKLRNCNTVLQGCDCHWYNAAWCYPSCAAANAARYLACQASNVVNYAACSAEFAASKALCYAKIAGIFLYDNLVKDLGDLSGDASVTASIYANKLKIIPGGLNSLQIQGTILTNPATTFVQVKDFSFTNFNLLSYLLITFPINHKNFGPIGLSVNKSLDIKSNISRMNLPNGDCSIKFDIEKFNVPIEFSSPLLKLILEDPEMVLRCRFLLPLLPALAVVVNLGKNEKLKKYLNAFLWGDYVMDIESKGFDIKLPVVSIRNNTNTVVFKPKWGTKSLIYSQSN